MTLQFRISGLCCLLILVSCQHKTERIRPVRQNITESVYASGIVKSDQQYQAFARASGIVDLVLVKEGDMVKKGQPIIKLSDSSAQLNIENARIAVQFATRTANTERLQELRVAIEQAAIKCRNDSLLLQRQKRLWSQQIGTRNELEQRELAFETSQNNYQRAVLQYATLNRQIRLQEQQSYNNLQIASNAGGDYVVKSGLDGRVYTILKKKGEAVTPQQPVAVIGDATRFQLELQVDEFDISRVKPGQKTLVTMDSYKGQVFEAHVVSIDPYMDPRTKTFTIKAAFEKAPPVLYPNLTCEANIIIQERNNRLTIPVAFLISGDYVLLQNKEKRKVHTGLKDYRQVEILEGITANDVLLKPEL